jgi:hypothetical protein
MANTSLSLVDELFYKTCTKCRAKQDSSEYYKDKSKPDCLYSHCKKCHSAYTRDWKSNNRKKVNEIARSSYQRNKEKISARDSAYRKNKYATDESYREVCKKRAREYDRENKEKVLVKQKISREKFRDRNKRILQAWYERNKENVKAKTKQYYALHKERLRPSSCAKTVRRQKRTARATPKWVDHAAIKSIYMQCAEISKFTGIKHHVDHIIPIRSDLVCGLHVENNLQIIPAIDNHIKSNKFDIDAIFY